MTTRTLNRMGKSRKPGDAYMTLIHPLTGWEYEVLKTYQQDGQKPGARAFCNVHGFATEMGDVWVKDVGTILVEWDRAVFTDAADALGALFGTGREER